MGTAYLKPILSASLPSQFRQIHLELARGRGHPEGNIGVAYTIIAPAGRKWYDRSYALARVSGCLPGDATAAW